MNARVEPQQRQVSLAQFQQEVLPPQAAAKLWRALPAHIKPEVFERNLTNALMQNPALMQLDSRLVYREVSKAAALGLLLDPQLGEAYIIRAYNGRTKSYEPQLRVGYKGMCKLARQAGDVINIYAHEVCANDRIECHLGTDKRLVHEPNVFSDRGDVVGYYAVIKYSDGSSDFEPMTVAQCQSIRDRSDAWKSFTAKKIYTTPWATDEGEMSKKTVLRRLLKRQPQSPELAEAIGIEDRADFPEMHEGAPARPAADEPPPPPPTAIEHKPTVPFDTGYSDMEMVEAGRFPPGEEIWEDQPPPPAPVGPQNGQSSIKQNLIRQIETIRSLADWDSFAGDKDFCEAKRKLPEAEQTAIDIALMRRRSALVAA